MEWIGCTVCEIFAFKLYCDLETRVWGHWRSSKTAPFDRAHRLYVHGNYVSISYRFRDIAAYWSKIATPLYLAPPLGVKSSDLHNDPWCQWPRSYRCKFLCSSKLFACIHHSTSVTPISFLTGMDTVNIFTSPFMSPLRRQIFYVCIQVPINE